MWLGRGIMEIEQPFHPIGQIDSGTEGDGVDMSIFTPVTPSYAEVLEVRAGRVAMVSDLLATGDALLPEEHVLALIHLKDVEQRLILDAEAERLQRAATAATAQRNDRSAQQLQAALEENRQLRAALDEARAKLDAITNIERSIRERENGPPDSQ